MTTSGKWRTHVLTGLARPLRNHSVQISEPTYTAKVKVILFCRQQYLQFSAQ